MDEPEIQIEVPPEVEVGVYANFALVSAGPHDFMIDFCQVMPQSGDEDDPPRARVVSRVRIAATFMVPLMQALSQNAFRRDELLQQHNEPADGEEAQ